MRVTSVGVSRQWSVINLVVGSSRLSYRNCCASAVGTATNRRVSGADCHAAVTINRYNDPNRQYGKQSVTRTGEPKSYQQREKGTHNTALGKEAKNGDCRQEHRDSRRGGRDLRDRKRSAAHA